MRRRIFFLITAAILCASSFTSVLASKKDLVKVRLNEVVHSIFYAPQYVAIELGFFEDEGLEVELSVGNGADKSMTALIAKEADIALLGTEAGLYVYNEGRDNYAISFAQLTQRAGNYLVSRTNDTDFNWSDVKGKTIIGGRAGGMPQMILEYILKTNGLDPKKDVEILTNLQFTTTAGAFVGGVGDYTMEFDPTALNLENENKGYVVASCGVDSGMVPYTVYMAAKEFINKNPDVIQKFTAAVYRSQIWVSEHSASEIAAVVAPHFPENDLESLEKMIDRYKSQDTWKDNPVFEEEGFNLLQDIMENGGELEKRVPYSDMVNTEFAEKAMK